MRQPFSGRRLGAATAPTSVTFVGSLMRIAKLLRPSGRASGVLAVLLIAALSTVVGPTPAHAATVSPADGVVPAYHHCENFGVAHRGYIAGQCIDLYEYQVGGTTYVAVQGQSFCQTSATHAIVQCAGIAQTLSIADSFMLGGNGYFYCGRYTTPQFDPACPTAPGRFENQYTPGNFFPVFCGDTYSLVMQTTLDLPVSGDTVTSTAYGEQVTLC